MPATPLHVAFVLPLLRRWPRLSFAAATLGALVPDLEQGILWALGDTEGRWLTHSLLGALSLDVVLTFFVAALLQRLPLERLGLYGYRHITWNRWFALSAALGAATHVLIDATHHRCNPTLWPLTVRCAPTPLVTAYGEDIADLLLHALTLLLLAGLLRRPLRAQGQGLRLFLTHPRTALRIVTQYYSGTSRLADVSAPRHPPI